ncbi:helix-turn-helix transcriptional regulator [Paenibacillus larvae]
MIADHNKETLRSLRIKFRYTQKEAAEIIGVSKTTLKNWEVNSSRIPYDKVKRIEEVYGVNQNSIFFGSEVAFSELIRRRRDSIKSA